MNAKHDEEALAQLRPPLPAGDLYLQVHSQGDQVISPRIVEQGVWEPYESELVQSLLGPGDVFVDVGANIGYFTVLAAERVGDEGRVFAFEPEPENHRLLCANIARNYFSDRVVTVEAALGEYEGRAELFLSEDNLGDHQVFAASAGRKSVPVAVLDGTSYLQTRTEQLDLIKIDAQGAEYAVVKGLMPLLQRFAGRVHILLELTPLSLRQAGASGRALVELVASLGQALWIVDHLQHRLVPESSEALARWCDNVDACKGDAGFMNILVGPAVCGADSGRRSR